MANKRGQLNCAENTKNVGFGSCVLNIKQIAGALLYDGPRTFTAVEIADMQATLIADAHADSKLLRMYPIHNFEAMTDNSEALVIETFDYGAKAPVRDGDIDWTFRYRDGGNCLNNSLRTHNGKRWVLFYDRDKQLLGFNKLGDFATIPLQFFYAHPFKPATGSTTSQLMVQFVMLAKYMNEEMDFVKLDFDPAEIDAIQDINIVLNSWDQDTGVANVTLQIACGAENAYDLFNAQIEAGTFQAFDDEGNEVTVSSVQANANKTFDITLATGDLPDDGTVTLSGRAVSVLTGQGIEDFEIGSVALEVVGS